MIYNWHVKSRNIHFSPKRQCLVGPKILFKYNFLVWIFVYSLFSFIRGILTIKELLINERIVANEVRLVGENGEQLGIVSLNEALNLSKEKDLDLALISPNANPVVCKIMDYGKYRFDQIKKEKDARKKNKAQEIKTIQLSLTIGDYDINYRVKNAKNFLSEGNKVKVSIRLKGRQQAYPEQGIEIMNKFAGLVGDAGVIEKVPKLEGRDITMIIGQKK